jgi:hypothetical protein
MNDLWIDTATWVQAVGAIIAVVGAAWVAGREARAAARREAQNHQESIERERHTLEVARTAALNLAILASTQIHELRVLLHDETRRGRIARMSPSRTLITTERVLTAFPIQSLGEADAMVGFSYFPGALETAAEVYANLEAAVRSASPGERHRVFAAFEMQMAQIDKAVQRRLHELRAIIQEEPRPAVEVAATSHEPLRAPAPIRSALLI